MTTDAQAPVDGALSIDQAIGLIAPEAAPIEAEPEAQASEEESEGAASAPEDAEEGAESPADGEEAEAEEPAAVEPKDPPKYWSQDAKAKFAELPPELQDVVLAQEGPREEATAKAKQAAAEKAQAYEAEVNAVRQFGEGLSQFLPQAIETFKSKWEGVDWKATLDAYGAEETLKLKEDMANEQAQVQQLLAAQQQAQSISAKQARQADEERLKTLAPHLSDKGKRDEVIKYAVETYGIPSELAGNATAFELAIAEKAMKWDRAQANLAAKPKSAPSPIKAPVKPGAKSASPTIRSADQVKNRFSQTRSVDDAVAWLIAKG